MPLSYMTDIGKVQYLLKTGRHVHARVHTSLMDQMVKNPPAVQETWVPSLGWEDSLEDGTATHSSILAWRIPVDRGAWRATVHGVPESPT